MNSASGRPPRLPRRLVEWFLAPDLSEPLLGDLDEAFAPIAAERGAPFATRWYWRESLRAILALTRPPAVDGHHNSSGDGVMTALLGDVRYALRSMRLRPGFTALAIATLALGIGATTAIFSAINPILIKPLPYPAGNRIAMIWESTSDGHRENATFSTFRDVQDRSRSFESMALIRSWQPTMTNAGEPVRYEGERVSAGYFHVLGVAPALGRDFLRSDDVLNGPSVVILSDALWRERFAADRSIVGRQIALNGVGYTVIGVMPHDFENIAAPEARVWAPLQYDVSLPWACRTCHHLRHIARLNPGVTLPQATRELAVISHALVQAHPKEYEHEGFIVSLLQDDVVSSVKPALLAVLGAVVLVLLIACTNVTSLLLARSAQRRGEFAVRVALGASRHRVMRQLLTESLLLAAAGGLAGIAIAQLGVRALVALSPASLPRLSRIGIDAPVFLFALAVTTVVGLAFGLIPALYAARADLNHGLQLNSRRAAGGGRTRRSLVAGEVALAVVLLVGSGLLLRSIERLFAIPPGFDASHLLTMQVQTAGPRFNDDSATRRFFVGALRAVEGVPGVVAAAFTSQLPLSGDFDGYGVHFETKPHPNPENDPSAFRYAVTADYFAAMKIPLRKGRLLDARDVDGAPRSAVINESFARRVLPGEDAVGQRVRIGGNDGPWFTIVGVVGDVKQASLGVTQSDAIYLNEAQWQFADGAMTLVARTLGDPSASTGAIRKAVWSVDKDQPITRAGTMSSLIAGSAAERRFILVLFEVFAIVALILAAAGIYGLLAGSVADRSREIGVRAALGATRGNILGMILRQGMVLAVAGLGVGLVGAIATSRAIVSMLYGVSPLDPATYGLVAVLLLTAAAGACSVPAWRAARVDPAVSLRSD